MKSAKFRFFLSTFLLFLLIIAPLTGAASSDEILLGAVYPMTGPSALGGQVAKYAIEAAVEIINNNYDLNLPLAKGEGLPNLGGAKIKVIFMDHQGSPEKGLSAAEKLIKQNRNDT